MRLLPALTALLPPPPRSTLYRALWHSTEIKMVAPGDYRIYLLPGNSLIVTMLLMVVGRLSSGPAASRNHSSSNKERPYREDHATHSGASLREQRHIQK